jgi:Zn ribbon nucleic-acid-binding protein
MRLTIERTDDGFVILNAPEVPCRVWAGFDEDGVPVRVLLIAVSPQTSSQDVLERYARELVEVPLLDDDEPPPPSITCPKCRRVSYNANDIRHRFCAVCGYHAEIPSA